MVNFIEDHRVDFGVEPICKVLPIATSTYYHRIAIARDPERASDRAKSDQANRKNIQKAWEDNHSVYGAKKVWHALCRQGKDIARCTVERLMKQMGIQGVVRGKIGLFLSAATPPCKRISDCPDPRRSMTRSPARSNHSRTCPASSCAIHRRFGTVRPASRQRSQRRWLAQVLEPVVARYRERDLRRYFRGDAAFASPDIYEFPEDEGFLYAIRLPKNQVLLESICHLLTRPVGRPPNHVRRYYASFSYRAKSRDKARRVVAKVEWCIFRDIRPPIPTTSAHLYRGIRPALTRCREALVFDISFLAFRHVVEGLSFGRIVRRVRAGRRCAPAGRGWHLRRWVRQ